MFALSLADYNLMTYLFLLLDLVLLLIPFALLLDPRFRELNWKAMLISSFVVMVIFAEAAVFLTGKGLWKFNPQYLIGAGYRGLPLEQYLFLFAFSFAGLAVYNYLNVRLPKNDLQKYSLAVSHLMMGICVAMLFLSYTKLYTVITFAFLLLLLIGVEYINTLRFMYKFYRAFLLMLIPFYLCNIAICNFPVISYEANEQLPFALANIPFENHFFMMGTLLLGVYMMEIIQHRLAKSWRG